MPSPAERKRDVFAPRVAFFSRLIAQKPCRIAFAKRPLAIAAKKSESKRRKSHIIRRRDADRPIVGNRGKRRRPRGIQRGEQGVGITTGALLNIGKRSGERSDRFRRRNDAPTVVDLRHAIEQSVSRQHEARHILEPSESPRITIQNAVRQVDVFTFLRLCGHSERTVLEADEKPAITSRSHSAQGRFRQRLRRPRGLCFLDRRSRENPTGLTRRRR